MAVPTFANTPAPPPQPDVVEQIKKDKNYRVTETNGDVVYETGAIGSNKTPAHYVKVSKDGTYVEEQVYGATYDKNPDWAYPALMSLKKWKNGELVYEETLEYQRTQLHKRTVKDYETGEGYSARYAGPPIKKKTEPTQDNTIRKLTKEQAAQLELTPQEAAKVTIAGGLAVGDKTTQTINGKTITVRRTASGVEIENAPANPKQTTDPFAKIDAIRASYDKQDAQRKAQAAENFKKIDAIRAATGPDVPTESKPSFFQKVKNRLIEARDTLREDVRTGRISDEEYLKRQREAANIQFREEAAKKLLKLGEAEHKVFDDSEAAVAAAYMKDLKEAKNITEQNIETRKQNLVVMEDVLKENVPLFSDKYRQKVEKDITITKEDLEKDKASAQEFERLIAAGEEFQQKSFFSKAKLTEAAKAIPRFIFGVVAGSGPEETEQLSRGLLTQPKTTVTNLKAEVGSSTFGGKVEAGIGVAAILYGGYSIVKGKFKSSSTKPMLLETQGDVVIVERLSVMEKTKGKTIIEIEKQFGTQVKTTPLDKIPKNIDTSAGVAEGTRSTAVTQGQSGMIKISQQDVAVKSEILDAQKPRGIKTKLKSTSAEKTFAETFEKVQKQGQQLQKKIQKQGIEFGKDVSAPEKIALIDKRLESGKPLQPEILDLRKPSQTETPVAQFFRMIEREPAPAREPIQNLRRSDFTEEAGRPLKTRGVETSFGLTPAVAETILTERLTLPASKIPSATGEFKILSQTLKVTKTKEGLLDKLTRIRNKALAAPDKIKIKISNQFRELQSDKPLGDYSVLRSKRSTDASSQPILKNIDAYGEPLLKLETFEGKGSALINRLKKSATIKSPVNIELKGSTIEITRKGKRAPSVKKKPAPEPTTITETTRIEYGGDLPKDLKVGSYFRGTFKEKLGIPKEKKPTPRPQPQKERQQIRKDKTEEYFDLNDPQIRDQIINDPEKFRILSEEIRERNLQENIKKIRTGDLNIGRTGAQTALEAPKTVKKKPTEAKGLTFLKVPKEAQYNPLDTESFAAGTAGFKDFRDFKILDIRDVDELSLPTITNRPATSKPIVDERLTTAAKSDITPKIEIKPKVNSDIKARSNLKRGTTLDTTQIPTIRTASDIGLKDVQDILQKQDLKQRQKLKLRQKSGLERISITERTSTPRLILPAVLLPKRQPSKEFNLRKKIDTQQPKKRTPTLFSAFTGLKAKGESFGEEITGLGLRPILARLK